MHCEQLNPRPSALTSNMNDIGFSKDKLRPQYKMTNKAQRDYCDFLGDAEMEILTSDWKPEDIRQLIKVANQHIREEPHSSRNVELTKLNDEHEEAVNRLHAVHKVIEKATIKLLSALQKTCGCGRSNMYAESEDPPVGMSAWDCEKAYGKKVRNVRDMISDLEKCGKEVAELLVKQ